ncbi:MAG: phenylalanine--tRNA ligase subunit beta [Clostridiales bacterium]|jgi:phenylalanyl-tRNA synthetase beta chain|nr:phenylalanine--tRNA ligase subunit beta [Clostridiales bacterium]
MKFPLSWIQDFTDIKGIEPNEFAHAMTMSGTKVESVTMRSDGIKNVVLGRITEVKPHPNADKLVICHVDVGRIKPLQIVTGSPRMEKGQLVPVALDGATLPNGTKIKKGMLREVESEGMLCSEEELFLDAPPSEHIMFLPQELAEEFPLGADICEVLKLNDAVIEVELTANRPDCQSIIGISREVAATFRRAFSLNEPPKSKNNEKMQLAVNIEAPNRCPRYSARMVTNARIEPSPAWLADRLKNSGIRAINGIVDITNYVCLEYGQPLHAFDFDKLAKNKDGETVIRVRAAEKGEEMTTLDGIKRKLAVDDLVIADAKSPLAIAGIMGGEGSGIDENTTNIVFESANFEGAGLRRTSRRLGLRTEASVRYEKGVDVNIAVSAVNRACELVKMLNLGTVVENTIDEGAPMKPLAEVDFVPERINGFLGADIPREFMVSALEGVGIKCSEGRAKIPPHRADISGYEDLAEEIARFYGYDNIPAAPLSGVMSNGGLTGAQKFRRRVAEIITAMGYDEILTYTFINPAEYHKLRLGDAPPQTVTIRNPLGEEHSIMRTQSIGSMMTALHNNYRLSNPKAWLFEIAKVFLPRQGEELPLEKEILTLGAYGDTDFYQLKGVLEALLDELGASPYEFKELSANAKGANMAVNDVFHPYRAAQLLIRGKRCGTIGAVHPEVAENYEIKGEVYAAELDFDALFAAHVPNKRFKPIAKFPAVTRDIALIVKKDVTIGAIDAVLRSVKNPILEGYKLFDVYSGGQVPEDSKSVAYSLTFRSQERTLVDAEVNALMGTIIAVLADKLHAEIRM